LIACALGGCKASRAEPSAAGLCVTKGAIRSEGGALTITDPTVRAVVAGSKGDSASLRFTYRGDTDELVALGSGQLRKQIGLKLRAEDGCNLVYVMWRFEPKPGIEVSIKANPGKHTHAECGTRGYQKVAADDAIPVARPEPGETHTLAATIRGDRLEASIDGDVVWKGELDPSARDLDGPAGVRSDNVKAVIDLTAGGAGKGACPVAGD